VTASPEADLIASLRALATHEGARGLLDDAAVLATDSGQLVLTCDMLVEGTHFLSEDPPADVAWKLVAVNLSDLAAKGARPVGFLLGFSLGDAEWDREFVAGFGVALRGFELPLLGGDTVSGAPVGARTLAGTAIGLARGTVPARTGARPGDHLWVTGAIGDAGAGLALLRQGAVEPASLIERYRAPRPRLEAGERLADRVEAMMDVSDGLLLDAARMAQASGCALTLDLDSVPLSEAWLRLRGDSRTQRLEAATAGDDYELLFAASPDSASDLLELAEELGLPMSRIGTFATGAGLSLSDRSEPVALPPNLGFEHRR
jgi:thiamine-monophosphate kinase